jgi:peptide/nickel transport system substrate-binding protein
VRRSTRLATVAASLLLAGLAAAQTAPRRAPEGTLTVAYHTFAKEVLDPGLHSTLGVMYHGHLFDYLIGTAPNGELAADRGLATSWTMSDGGQTWTLKLRPNVKWHDGKPFTADDVVFTFMERYQAKDAVCTFCGAVKRLVGEVKATDPHTVVFRLKKPDITFFGILSSRDGDAMVVPRHGYKAKADGFDQIEPPIGTGPWKFVERKVGDSITFEANTAYWDPNRTAEFARMKVLLRPEASARFAALRAGEVDMATVDASQARQAKSAGLKLLGPKGVSLPVLAFHASFDPQYLTNKVEFRKALALAIDMDAIFKRMYAGAEDFVARATNTGFWSPPALGYDTALKPYSYAPDEAKRLLQQIRYDGRPLKVWSYPAGNVSEVPELLELVAGFWSAVGIKVELTPIDFGAFRVRYISEPHKFEPNYAGHVAVDVGFPRPTMLSNLVVAYASHKAGGPIQAFHDLGFMDGAIDRLQAIKDLKELDGALRELNRRMHAEYTNYPLVYRDVIFAAGPKVGGWSPGNYGVAWYFETVTRAR